LLFNLVIVFTCYVYYTLVRFARGVRERSTRIYRCQVCEHVYVDDRDVPLARCPRCGCLNEAVRR
jgi:hypothetical protein